MNLIEAWKKAKSGQLVKRKENSILVGGGVRIQTYMSNADTEDLLADDWEIVKEKKKVVFPKIKIEREMLQDGIRQRYCLFFTHPPENPQDCTDLNVLLNQDIKMTLEWEE